MRDKYLQLTRYTWSTRRSAGTASSPSARWGPFHSTSIGGRPRSASRARRNVCPFMNDATNRSRWLPSFHASCRRWKSSAPTFSSAAGGSFNATPTSSSPHIPIPVTISVMAVLRSANGLRQEAGADLVAPARRVLAQPFVALGGAHLDRVEEAALLGDLAQRDVALAALARQVR